MLTIILSILLIQNINSFTTPPTQKIKTTLQSQASYGLYEVQEELITKQAKHEETLMTNYQGPLQTKPLKKGSTASTGVGFGAGNKINKATLRAQGKGYAQILKNDGVVRIDNILSKEQCHDLSEFITELRHQSEIEIKEGSIPQSQRYADVLLRKNRCDLTMPLNTITLTALNTILNESPIGTTLESALGKKAPLHEFSCLISDYGSDRQNIHPDTPIYDGDDSIAVLYTCFIVLQDVALDMGPTLWMPGTHTSEVHELFQDDDGKDGLLRENPYVLGVLPAGSCGIFDSRALHCGTGNNVEGSCRKVFYVSFQNPKIGYPGNPPSIRPELKGRLTLDVLKKELSDYCNPKKRADAYPVIDALMSSMK